jgi:hypothetical protein
MEYLMANTKCTRFIFSFLLLCASISGISSNAAAASHPRLMADSSEIARAKQWINQFPWYRSIFDANRARIDRFIEHGPIFVSPIKQTYQYQPYSCTKHDVDLLYEEFRPHEHRCPKDTTEIYRGAKYDASWAGWYNRRLSSHLVWMGLLWQTTGDEKYAKAGREILLKFADLYLQYPTENTILGPAHVFFGTLSESFWGVDMAYGYDFLFDYKGFTDADRKKIKERLFYPLAAITQQFPESASNRQLWYNNVSAAVGFLYDDQQLINFALKGTYGFDWQLGSALPESGFWPEWSGYHFVALRGMIHLAEMARHNGLDLYHREIAGRTMKKMFDAPFKLIKPNLEFPRNKDSGGGRILEYATFWEIGYSVYHDSLYLALLSLTGLQRGKQVVAEESGAGETENPISLFNLEPDLPTYRADIYPEQSINLDGNGFALLRNGTGQDRRYLYLDYGIMGGEHGHPDRLQMGYFALGRSWIVDPLNEQYFNPNLQLWYRQSIAHNTVVLDQTTQTWTNGYYRFFGALPALQVASGASTTEYPGARLTRTLLQVGDYFVDLCDIQAREARLIDWPLHSFGKLTVEGVNLEPEPADRFGKQPGIPGYDQLTDISSGKTSAAWSGLFTDEDGQHLLVRAIGEQGTELFRAINPRLGGFYKQMVKDPKPLPMLMSRRRSAATRFAHLIQAYNDAPSVTAFGRATEPNTYRITRTDGEDLLFADTDSLKFWMVRSAQGNPSRLSAFNVADVRSGAVLLLESPVPVERIECRWSHDTLAVESPGPLGQTSILAPEAKVVMLNGSFAEFTRSGQRITLRKAGTAYQISTTSNDTLFLGLKNVLTVRANLPESDHSSFSTPAKITMAEDTRERIASQLSWWGGIVNLKAFNKGPVTRIIAPGTYENDFAWLTSAQEREEAGGLTQKITVRVPNDAPPVDIKTTFVLGQTTVNKTFTLAPPLQTEIFLPNGGSQVILVRVRNVTPNPLSVKVDVVLHKAWKAGAPLKYVDRFRGREEKTFSIPVELTGYNPDNQLYPVHVRLSADRFSVELVRDIYAGVAHHAATSPRLDGSWHGWDTTRPITIDKPTQVCRLLLGNQPWHGKKDLSAKVYVMYDDSSLYVGANVLDDSLVTHWDFPRMSYPWDTDCMEAILDTRTGADQGTDPPTPGLFRHLSMAEHRLTEFPPEKWQGGGAGGPTLPKPLLVLGAETFFVRTRDGYALMCRYPLASPGRTALKPGAKLGFDLAISDNDGTTYRKNQHIWAGFTQNQSWLDLGTMGVLLLR